MDAFKAAYHRENRPSGQSSVDDMTEELWAGEVMGRIRSLASPAPAVDVIAICERMFWRFAPAAALMVCILSIWLFQVDATVEYDVASLMVTEPVAFGELSSLGL